MTLKDPDLDYPIHPLIQKRWSPCVFSDQKVEERALLSLFEAARWAPSCYNEQPWSWVIGFNGDEAFDKILSLLAEPNQAWAGKAPVLGISIARLHFEKNGKPNRHALHDVGLAMSDLCIQATVEGLYVHQMAGFRYKEAEGVFNLPEGHEAVAAFAIGHKGDPEGADEAHKGRDLGKRERQAIADKIHYGQWGRRWLKESQ